MFLKAQFQWNVIIPAENLNAIIVHLLDELSAKKLHKYYFFVVTTLDKIGEGKVRQHSGDVLFPVTFICLTYKAFAGEVLEGEVHGVFLRCGLVEHMRCRVTVSFPVRTPCL